VVAATSNRIHSFVDPSRVVKPPLGRLHWRMVDRRPSGRKLGRQAEVVTAIGLIGKALVGGRDALEGRKSEATGHVQPLAAEEQIVHQTVSRVLSVRERGVGCVHTAIIRGVCRAETAQREPPCSVVSVQHRTVGWRVKIGVKVACHHCSQMLTHMFRLRFGHLAQGAQ